MLVCRQTRIFELHNSVFNCSVRGQSQHPTLINKTLALGLGTIEHVIIGDR